MSNNQQQSRRRYRPHSTNAAVAAPAAQTAPRPAPYFQQQAQPMSSTTKDSLTQATFASFDLSQATQRCDAVSSAAPRRSGKGCGDNVSCGNTLQGAGRSDGLQPLYKCASRVAPGHAGRQRCGLQGQNGHGENAGVPHPRHRAGTVLRPEIALLPKSGACAMPSSKAGCACHRCSRTLPVRGR